MLLFSSKHDAISISRMFQVFEKSNVDTTYLKQCALISVVGILESNLGLLHIRGKVQASVLTWWLLLLSSPLKQPRFLSTESQRTCSCSWTPQRNKNTFWLVLSSCFTGKKVHQVKNAEYWNWSFLWPTTYNPRTGSNIEHIFEDQSTALHQSFKINYFNYTY